MYQAIADGEKIKGTLVDFEGAALGTGCWKHASKALEMGRERHTRSRDAQDIAALESYTILV